MIQWMLAIWSLVPAFCKFTLNIWKFTVCILLKPGLENFDHYSASVWDECNCAVVWTSFGSYRKQGNSKKHLLLLYWLCQSLWQCGSQQTVENSSRDGNTSLIYLLRNLYASQEATVRTGHRTTDWFQIRKGVHHSCILSPCLVNLYTEYHAKCQAGWSTSWNQDFQEKYQ